MKEHHWTEAELLARARKLIERGYTVKEKWSFLDACREYDNEKARTAEQLRLWNGR